MRDICVSETFSHASVVDNIFTFFFQGDYVVLALRNYQMQPENLYYYLKTVKLLTHLGFLKHAVYNLEMLFVIYEAIYNSSIIIPSNKDCLGQ